MAFPKSYIEQQDINELSNLVEDDLIEVRNIIKKLCVTPEGYRYGYLPTYSGILRFKEVRDGKLFCKVKDNIVSPFDQWNLDVKNS